MNLVIRTDAAGNPKFFYKSFTDNTLTAVPDSSVTTSGTLYIVNNSDGVPAYHVSISGIAYGDEFEIDFAKNNVAHYYDVQKNVSSVWTDYSKYNPMDVGADNSFTLTGRNLSYAPGPDVVSADYKGSATIENNYFEISGNYTNSDGASFSDGDYLQFTIVKKPVMDGTTLVLHQTSNIPKGGDTWEVNTYAMVKSNIDLSNVKVVPNPIYPINKWDKNVTDRKAEFINLPAECDIYIYNVAGDLIRHLVHNNGTGTEEWDVRNKNNQDIASGVYVYLIYVDDNTKKEGTFAVIR